VIAYYPISRKDLETARIGVHKPDTGAGNEEEPPLTEQDGAIEPQEYDRDSERQYVDGVSDGSPRALRGDVQRLCRFFYT